MESCHFPVFLKCHSWLCDFTFTTLTAKSISIYSLPWLLTLQLCPRFFKNFRNGKVSYWKPKHRKKRYLVYSERGIQWHIPCVWICKGTCSIVLFSWISHNQFSQLYRDFFFFFFEVWIMTLLQLQLCISWHFYLKILNWSLFLLLWVSSSQYPKPSAVCHSNSPIQKDFSKNTRIKVSLSL